MMRAKIAAVSISLAVASLAYAAEPATLSPYTVQEGDTCGSVAKKVLGDPRKVNLIHDNNELGPPPHRLRAGQILKLPLPAPRGPDALVTFVRNLVEKYVPERVGARVNDELFRGNRVNTRAASSAELSFADKTQMQLGPDTLVVILGENSGAAARHASAADASLVSGALRAHLSALAGGTKIISTPGGQASLDQGVSQISVDEAKATRLAVYQGKSRLRASGVEVQVPAGYGSKAENGIAPSKPKLLPPPPVWDPTPASLIVSLEDAATFDAGYRAGGGPGPNATQWHLQMARDARFNDLVFDKEVPANVVRMRVRRIAAGAYFVRASAIDDDHFEGVFTAPLTVTAALARATKADVDVGPAYKCGVDGNAGLVAGRIQLDRRGEHRLRCVSIADESVSGEFVVPLVPPKFIVRGNLEGTDAQAGHGRLFVNVTTADGKPAAGKRLAVLGDAVVSSAVETEQPGLYIATLKWKSGATVLHLRVQVLGTDVVEPIDVPVSPK